MSADPNPDPIVGVPSWVLDVVTVVEDYEYAHPDAHGVYCLADALDAVPADIRAEARGWARARRACGREHGERT